METRQQTEELERKILTLCSDGLRIGNVPKCGGRGLFATKRFLEGDFICVYTGVIITQRQFRELYHDVPGEKCYTFHMQHDSRFLVVDATNEDGSMARVANHSWKKFNARMEKKVVRGIPYLVLFAAKDINVGHEIRYNYGDEVVEESGHQYGWLREVVDYN